MTNCTYAIQVLHEAGANGLSQQDLFQNAKTHAASPWKQQALEKGLHQVWFGHSLAMQLPDQQLYPQFSVVITAISLNAEGVEPSEQWVCP